MRICKQISFIALLLSAWLCSVARQEIALQPGNKSGNSQSAADTAEVNRLNRLSVHYLQTDLDSVRFYSQQALELARKLNYKAGIGKAYINSSTYNMKMGNTVIALKEGFEALKLYEEISVPAGISEANLQVALVYKEIAGSEVVDEYLVKGIKHGRQAYATYSALADTAGMANSLNILGIIFRDRAKRIPSQAYYYDSALHCYERGIKMMGQSGISNNLLGRLYNNTSQVLLEYKKDYAAALDYSFKAVEYNRQRNRETSLTHNYINIADIYRRMKKHQLSLEYAIRANEIALRLNSPTRLMDTYGMMHSVYKALGRYDSAMHYYIMSDRIVDSFANVRKTAQIAEMQTQYETVKKEAEIHRLNTENTSKTRQIAVLAGGVLLFGLIAGAMVWLYRRVNNQKQLISRQSKQMELMMKELHHRVKNNLQIVSSLLSLQTYRLTDKESIAALRESQQRVQAMSFIHQRLYKTDELTTVNVKEYITDLTESLLASYGYDRDGFDLQISIDNEMLDVDKALPIGLIVNEIVTNAFKYAYKDVERPSLHITCTEQGNDINLSIHDNGGGLDEKIWKKSGGSFGKQLVTTLCRQLRAQQTLEVSNGTRFHFVIPKNVLAA